MYFVVEKTAADSLKVGMTFETMFHWKLQEHAKQTVATFALAVQVPRFAL